MTNEEIDQSGIGILPFFSQELGKEFMTNNLTPFQQELMDAAGDWCGANGWVVSLDERGGELANGWKQATQLQEKAKAKFMELVRRAVPIEEYGAKAKTLATLQGALNE